MKSKEFNVVFEGKSIDANFVKNILEENNIRCMLKDDLMGQLFPLFVTHGGIKPVKVFVLKNDIKEAKNIITSYVEN